MALGLVSERTPAPSQEPALELALAA